MATQTKKADALVVQIPTVQLLTSPTNPRRSLGDLAELAESIKAKGVLQPILVRRCDPAKDGAFEIVFGHRRVQAARIAELSEVPAMVRDMTDQQALEAQLIENCQRSDIHPLEEADSFKTLHETHGSSVEELAAKIGKSPGYVYGRLKLCGLVAEAREKFLAGTFSVSVALLVARLPRVEQQREAVEKLVAEADYLRDENATLSLDAAADLLEDFHLELKTAPFPLDVVDLVEGAGSCSACPKRSTNQPVLFRELAQGDVCTDAVCFGDKRKAWLARQKAEAEAKGLKVLKAGQARKALGYGSPLIKLDELVSAGDQNKTVRQILGKKHGLEVQLAPTDEGVLVEVVDRKAVNEAFKKAGNKARVPTPTQAPRAPAGGDEKWQAQQKRQKEKREAEEKVRAAVLDRVLEAIERDGVDDKTWRFLAETSLQFADIEATRRFFKDTHVPRDRKKRNQLFAKMSIAKVQAFVICANLLAGGDDDVIALAEVLGIDHKAVGADMKKAETAAVLQAEQAKVNKAVAAMKSCALPGCPNPIKRAGFCAYHGSTLSGTEQKSIIERNKRLVAEGLVKKVSPKKSAHAHPAAEA